MRDRGAVLAGMVLLAVAIGLGSVVLANGIRDRNRNDVLTVTGSAKRRIASDYVVWNSEISAEGSSAPATSRLLDRWTKGIRDFLRAQGARAGEISVAPISTSTQDTKHGVVYTLTRTFTVSSSRVKVIGKIADHSSDLLAQNIPISPESPQYSYTKLAALRPQLLAQAVRDARTRARALVDAAGGKLDKLRGVDAGVFQVTAPNSTDVSDYGEYDTSTVAKDVTAVVNVTFGVG